jgi:serine/threonine-protein kinase
MPDLIDGRYEASEIIAGGGMATVWRGLDTRLGRPVAIKRPRPGADDDLLARRFTREARIAAGISHPNVVTVFDSGADDLGPYLVMELVEGPTLAQRSLEPGAVRSVGAQLADALAAIHAAGIIHRDVKPGNVIISERGPLLTDFGIAFGADASTRFTVPGQVLATPAYAAPEVLAGERATAASDVYSLAVVVHEGLTGLKPAPGQAPATTSELDEVLGAALSPDPASRPSAVEFAAALRGVPLAVEASEAGGQPTVMMAIPDRASTLETTVPVKRGRRFALAATGLTVAAAVLVTLVLLRPLPASTADAGTAVAASSTSSAPTTSTPGTSTSTTVPPTTAATSTTTTLSGVEATQAFIEFISSIGPPTLKPKDERDILERVYRLTQRDDAEKRVREIDHKLGSIRDRATEAQARELFADMLGALGLS